MTRAAAANDRIEVHSSRLWALVTLKFTRLLFPARLIADHVGISTSIVEFWLTPWRRTDEHLPLSHIAEVTHTCGFFWDSIRVESSGGPIRSSSLGCPNRRPAISSSTSASASTPPPLRRRRRHLAVELEPLLAGGNHDSLAVLDAAGEDHFR